MTCVDTHLRNISQKINSLIAAAADVTTMPTIVVVLRGRKKMWLLQSKR
jgi:hypothetical protein